MERLDRKAITGTEGMRPKVFTYIRIPRISEGMCAVRFHGFLAIIPARDEGEPLVGKSKFTQRQIEALVSLRGEVSQRALAENSFGASLFGD